MISRSLNDVLVHIVHLNKQDICTNIVGGTYLNIQEFVLIQPFLKFVHIDVAWKVFTDVFKQAYTNNKCPTRKEFKDNMIKRYGKPDKGTTWYGLSYNQTDKHNFINDESELDI